jgi:hypothetical protein
MSSYSGIGKVCKLFESIMPVFELNIWMCLI